MSYETVEAIQCVIPDIGTVLITGTPDSPPQQISGQEIEGLRVFDKPNEYGPSFHYIEHKYVPNMWALHHKVEGTATE